MIMNFPEIERIVNDHLDLIKIDAVGLAEGKPRAARFLVVQSLLANYLKDLQDARAKVSTVVDASYAQAIQTAEGKNITEKKTMAEANPLYAGNREGMETLDSEINWIKVHMDIFNNAHLMFRQYSRE